MPGGGAPASPRCESARSDAAESSCSSLSQESLSPPARAGPPAAELAGVPLRDGAGPLEPRHQKRSRRLRQVSSYNTFSTASSSQHPLQTAGHPVTGAQSTGGAFVDCVLWCKEEGLLIRWRDQRLSRVVSWCGRIVVDVVD